MKLTDTQRRVLQNYAAERRTTHGFKPGRSTAGGLSGTVSSLFRRGLVDKNGITAAGRAALATVEQPAGPTRAPQNNMVTDAGAPTHAPQRR